MTQTAASRPPRLAPADLERLARRYADAVAARRRRTILGFGLLVLAIVAAGWVGEVRPAKFFAEAWRFTSYLGDITPKLGLEQPATDVAAWFWGWKRWFRLLGETLLVAYVGTLVGGIGAFLACFLAAGNLVSRGWIRFGARRLLEVLRTVPEIVFALIFVVAFGLGPLPGALALALHSFGALGKLFAEVVENIDMKPVDGVTACGGSFVQVVRFAVMPQVLSNFAGYALLRFEINVRGATVMGLVGAGGIGQDLIEAIRKFYYSDVSAILVLIIATVMLIDLLTERLRHGLIGAEARP